jgi:HAD superfamily hydrolase (TIGR01484 family)
LRNPFGTSQPLFSYNAQMTFKALIFDLDGTAIPNSETGMPSSKVIATVNKAKQFCHVSVATGRPYGQCKEILEALEIRDLCILNGGTHLYDPKNQEYVWKQELDVPTLHQLLKQLLPFSQYQIVDENLQPLLIKDYCPQHPIGLPCIDAVSAEDTPQILEIARSIPGVTAHAVHSWTEGAFDIHITHELATKKHALQSLLNRLCINHSEAMVVGDGGNDLPLFELAGWKVAMGNAQPELKAAADWIAPSVEEDGLAVAIEKFILVKQVLT